MKVVYKTCCGLDVHKKIIAACILNGDKKELKSFGTMTDDILELVEWIKEHQCEAVAMESTGVYWKPIYNLLELDGIKTLVVNAKHMKAVPGRKTDIKDAEWIADLLKHGLLKASYIPSRDQRELRELVRYRKSIIEERSREITRIQKILEGANIKLSSVVTDVMCVSGRRMLEAIINGSTDPKFLASLALGKLRDKTASLEKSLKGLIAEHQKMILSAQLKHIDFLSNEIEVLSSEIENRLKGQSQEIELLDGIPGIGVRTAENIIAEMGSDMSRFPTANHLASWAGLCPGNNESAGKKKSTRTREGDKTLRSALVEAARSAAKKKNTYFYAQYHRIAARRGKNRAAVTVAHSLCIVIYHMLSEKRPYYEIGADHFDKINEKYRLNRLKTQLESLGYTVTKVDESA